MMRRSPKPLWAKQWPADSLQGRYLADVRPVLIDKPQHAIARACGNAVNPLSAFTDGPTVGAGVDNPLVDKHVAWLANRRFTDRTGIAMGDRVRYVARGLGPSGCPSMRTPSNRPFNPTSGTTWHFFATRDRPQRMLDAKPISIEKYRVCFNRLEWQHLRELLIGELASDRALAAASFNSIRRKLLTIARESYAVKLLSGLPRVVKLREPLEEPTSWDQDEVDSLLTVCAAQRGTVSRCKIPAGQWWTCLARLALNTGLRRRALLALNRVDVDLKRSTLRVPAAAMKNARGKSYKLCAITMEAIRAIWLPAREKLLPWDIRRECFGGKPTAILAEAGLPAGRRGKFHKLRHTTGTTIAAAAGLTKSTLAINRSPQRKVISTRPSCRISTYRITWGSWCIDRSRNYTNPRRPPAKGEAIGKVFPILFIVRG